MLTLTAKFLYLVPVGLLNILVYQKKNQENWDFVYTSNSKYKQGKTIFIVYKNIKSSLLQMYYKKQSQ